MSTSMFRCRKLWHLWPLDQAYVEVIHCWTSPPGQIVVSPGSFGETRWFIW